MDGYYPNVGSLPANIQALPPPQPTVWMNAYNAAYAANDSDSTAMAQAAVNKYVKAAAMIAAHPARVPGKILSNY